MILAHNIARAGVPSEASAASRMIVQAGSCRDGWSGVRRRMAARLVAVALGFGVLVADAGAASLLSPRLGSSARGVRTAYVDRETGEVLATVRFRVVRTEYERRGYFRIGAIPFVVVEGTLLELRDDTALRARWPMVAVWLGELFRDVEVEFRDVLVKRRGEVVPILEAKRMRITNRGDWVLSDGLSIWAGRERTDGVEGVLVFDRTDGGTLRMLLDGEWRELPFPPPGLASAQTTSQEKVSER